MNVQLDTRPLEPVGVDELSICCDCAFFELVFLWLSNDSHWGTYLLLSPLGLNRPNLKSSPLKSTKWTEMFGQEGLALRLLSVLAQFLRDFAKSFWVIAAWKSMCEGPR